MPLHLQLLNCVKRVIYGGFDLLAHFLLCLSRENLYSFRVFQTQALAGSTFSKNDEFI